jgi:hypothetical protein
LIKLDGFQKNRFAVVFCCLAFRTLPRFRQGPAASYPFTAVSTFVALNILSFDELYMGFHNFLLRILDLDFNGFNLDNMAFLIKPSCWSTSERDGNETRPGLVEITTLTKTFHSA